MWYFLLKKKNCWNLMKTFIQTLNACTGLRSLDGHQNQPVPSSILGFSNTGTLVSYCSPTKRVTILFSTFDLHKNELLDENHVKMWLQLIQFYNNTKEELIPSTRCATARVSRRWPSAVFCAMLDIGGLNATILYRLNQCCQIFFLWKPSF